MFSFASPKLEGLLKSKSVIGLECILSAEGTRQFNYVVLKKEKNRLITDSSADSLNDIGQLKTALDVSFPVHLVFNGKGIIHKKFPLSPGETDSSLLNKIFPAANLNDFYLQQVKSDEASQIVSVIRKTIADLVFHDLKQAGFSVIACSLGPFCFQSLFPMLDNDSTGREVVVSGYKLSLAADSISDFEPTDIPNSDLILTGGEKLKQEFVVAFASAVQYFIAFGEEVAAGVLSVQENRDEFRQMKLFKTAGLSALIFFVAALIINFILFMHYSGKHNEYDGKASMNQSLLLEYETLKMEVGKKQAFLEKSGLLEASRTSFYADKIAMDVPESIQLAKLSIFPSEKRSNSDEQDISFIPKTVLLSGSCKKSTELNEWMGVLKKKEWVKQVSIANYTQDKSENTGTFSIELMMK